MLGIKYLEELTDADYFPTYGGDILFITRILAVSSVPGIVQDRLNVCLRKVINSLNFYLNTVNIFTCILCMQITNALLKSLKEMRANRPQRSSSSSSSSNIDGDGNDISGDSGSDFDDNETDNNSVTTVTKKVMSKSSSDMVENLAEGFFVLRRIFDPSPAYESTERKIYFDGMTEENVVEEAEFRKY